MSDAPLHALIVRTLAGAERDRIREIIRQDFGASVPDATIDAAISANAPTNYGAFADAIITNLRAAGYIR